MGCAKGDKGHTVSRWLGQDEEVICEDGVQAFGAFVLCHRSFLDESSWTEEACWGCEIEATFAYPLEKASSKGIEVSAIC